MLTIEHINYFVPPEKLKIETCYEQYNITQLQAKVFSRIYGLQNIPVSTGFSMIDLLREPVVKLIEETGVNKDQIKVFIHSHTNNLIAKFGRSVIRELKESLGLKNALAFGMSLNKCASTMNALETAAILLKNHNADAKAIVVVGEKAFTPIVQVIPNVSIAADAAVALLVSLNGKDNKLVSLEMKTIGKYSKGVWMSPEESKDFEAIYVPTICDIIYQSLRKANLTIRDIKVILPHNVNLISWSNIIKRLNINSNKVYLKNIKRYAHCFGADIFINYVDAKADNYISKDDYFMFVTIGLGATFAAAVFQH